MEILRSCRQTSNVTEPNSQPAGQTDAGLRALGAGELHIFGCQSGWFQVQLIIFFCTLLINNTKYCYDVVIFKKHVLCCALQYKKSC